MPVDFYSENLGKLPLVQCVSGDNLYRDICQYNIYPVNKSLSFNQGGDSAAGMQALPVGKIIDDKVCRKDNQKGIANLQMLKDI